MPVISFANTKGGSGKSTGCLLLACELAEQATVAVIDADPRHPITKWSQKAEMPGNGRLTVITSNGERTILDEIEDAAEVNQFVLVDLEGSASRLASFAIGESDLVIVAMQEQGQDADAAIETLQEIARESRSRRREIPSAVLFSRTKAAVKSRTHRHVQREFRAAHAIRLFKTEVNERDAFSALFVTGGGLRQLDPKEVNGIDKAIENAGAFASEVVGILREAMQ